MTAAPAKISCFVVAAILINAAKRASGSREIEPELQDEIDELAGQLYGLSRAETQMLREHYLVLSGQIGESA